MNSHNAGEGNVSWQLVESLAELARDKDPVIQMQGDALGRKYGFL